MELNWSTFILEIINFLVLVWILKRFFYKPVLDIIARRRAGIEKTLTDANTRQTEAETLRSQYENRLADWEQERQKARDALQREIEATRSQRMEELQETLNQERQKARGTELRKQEAAIRNAEIVAIKQGAQFAARLLSQLSGPELEAKLLTLLLDELGRLPKDRIASLHNTWGKPPELIEVASAYPLSKSQQQKLEQTFTSVTGLNVPFRYQQDADLIAGFRLTIGAWILGANVQDELKGFADFAHETQQA